MRLAIDEINNNTRLLPDHVLGYEDVSQGPGGRAPLPGQRATLGGELPLLPDHELEYVGNHTGTLAEFTSIQAGEDWDPPVLLFR